MSVLCQNKETGQFVTYVKGSPEKISELCLSATLPSDFQQTLETYTREGYRVIALATKSISDCTLARD